MDGEELLVMLLLVLVLVLVLMLMFIPKGDRWCFSEEEFMDSLMMGGGVFSC